MTIRSSHTALAALMAVSMLAACGGSDAPTSEANTEQTASTTPPTTISTSSPTLADALGIEDLPSITNNTFDNGEEIQLPQASRPSPQPVVKRLEPLPAGTQYHSQDASHLEALFASALEFNSKNLKSTWLASEPTLLDDRAYIETLACHREEAEFKRMVGNEFEYQDYITTKQSEYKSQTAAFTDTLPEDSNSKYALFWVVVTEDLGDYDFESEAFAFDPFPYDYLRETIHLDNDCRQDKYNGDKKGVAGFFPEQARLWLDFGPGVSSLPLAKDDARAYLQSVSKYGDPNRNVKVDMLIKVPLRFEDIADRTAVKGTYSTYSRRVNLVQKPTEIVAIRVSVGPLADQQLEDEDRSILGEFMPAYFGVELAE